MVELASDFLDRNTPVFRDDVCFFISQSGELFLLFVLLSANWREMENSVITFWMLQRRMMGCVCLEWKFILVLIQIHKQWVSAEKFVLSMNTVIQNTE